MPKRNFETLEDFKRNLHKEGATIIDFNGIKIPCILIDSKKYEEVMGLVIRNKLTVDVMLDIFHDTQDVFVDVRVKFLDTNMEENYLLYANDQIDFFETLAHSGLIAMLPSDNSSQNIFMVQLPKKDNAERALHIIKSNFKKQRS